LQPLLEKEMLNNVVSLFINEKPYRMIGFEEELKHGKAIIRQGSYCRNE